MRFYLDLPLLLGLLFLGITTSLGMLQFAAARGGYLGLSLFVHPSAGRRGVWTGMGIVVGGVLLYRFFAPEVFTPGPAGTEVAELFALCALIALIITLTGASLRWETQGEADETAPDQPALPGRPVRAGALEGVLYPARAQERTRPAPAPVICLLPDPGRHVNADHRLVERLTDAGFAVLRIGAAQGPELDRLTLLGCVSTALEYVSRAARDDVPLDPTRVGLLGLGLGGDIVLRAAVKEAAAAAVLAIAPRLAEEEAMGLDLLRPFTYRQAWRWRRRWGREREILQRLDAATALTELGSRPAAVLYAANAPFLATEPLPADRSLAVPGADHRRLLKDEAALDAITAWFWRHLGGSIAA
ncbi:MAG: hypothetical protein D6759_18955 [Chloroflexi bacterium]|nr:MAG: hypothetical protein D6759_18955 [Chloroflexota bacterium]